VVKKNDDVDNNTRHKISAHAYTNSVKEDESDGKDTSLNLSKRSAPKQLSSLSDLTVVRANC